MDVFQCKFAQFWWFLAPRSEFPPEQQILLDFSILNLDSRMGNLCASIRKHLRATPNPTCTIPKIRVFCLILMSWRKWPPKSPFFLGGGGVFSFTRTCSTRTSITWSASWTSSWARASPVYRSSSIKSVQKGWDTSPSWWAPLPIPTKFRFLPVEPPQNDIISFPHPPLPCPGPGHIGKRNRLPRLHEGKGEGCLHQVAQLWGHHPWEGISIMTKSGDFTPKFQFQPQVWVKPIQHPLNIQYRALPTEEHSVFFPTTEIQQRILIYCIVCWRHRSYKLKYNYDFNTFFLLLGLAGLSQRSGQWLRWLGHRSGGERQCN